jgi:hypothetical protein
MSEEYSRPSEELIKHAQLVAHAAYTRLQIEGKIPSLYKWCPHTPNPKQLVLLEGDFLSALYGGAVGGGKTGLLLMAALKYVDNPKYRALILRCSYPALKEPGGILDQLREWLNGTGARWRDKEMEFTFPSGAVIRFGHLGHDNALQRYIGGAYHFIGLDQLEQFSEYQFRFLFSRMRKRKDAMDIPLRVYATANPSDEAQWIFDWFVDPERADFDGEFTYTMTHTSEDGKKFDSIFVPAVLYDNPGLDHESYLDSLAYLDPVDRQRLLMGDWNVKPKGDIYRFDPRYHIITQSEFRNMYSSKHIPEDWFISMGLDWGASKDSLTALSYSATAPKYAPLKGNVYIFREKTFLAPIEDEVATWIINTERLYDEASRIQYRKISHEAATEMRVFAQKYKLHFDNSLPNASAGIGIVRYYLTIAHTDKENPFRPQLRGCPRMMLVVEDGQGEIYQNKLARGEDDKWLVKPAINERGLKQHRAEFGAYRWEDGKPRNRFNDMMDAVRNTALSYPAPKGLSAQDRADEALVKNLQLSEINKIQDFGQRQSALLRRNVQLAIMEKIKANIKQKITGHQPVWSRKFS